METTDAKPAIVVVAPVESDDAAFRREAREEFRHIRDQLKKFGEAIDLLLKRSEVDGA